MVAQHLKTPCPLYLCTIILSKAHPEKRKTLIMVGQLISSVTLTVLQTNHFLKEQSLFNATRTKPSCAIRMFLARLTSQTATQMRIIMKQLWEFYPTLK